MIDIVRAWLSTKTLFLHKQPFRIITQQTRLHQVASCDVGAVEPLAHPHVETLALELPAPHSLAGSLDERGNFECGLPCLESLEAATTTT